MSEREKILGRIREALRVEAPFPGAHGGHPSHPPATVAPGAIPLRPVERARAWLPEAGDTPEQHLARFGAACAELKTTLHRVTDLAAAALVLQDLAQRGQWKRVGAHHGKLTDAACNALTLEKVWTDGGYPVDALEACDAGITECDALIAQTGTIIVTSTSAGGRALSVLPPHHIVVALQTQLVGDLTDGFALLRRKYGDRFPSMMSLITGPSRTGDIERILVLGAHGPKELTVILADRP